MLRKAVISDAKRIAYLHRENLPSGFLSSLPAKALEKIYMHIIKHEIVLVVEESAQIVGYVTVASNTKKMFNQFVKQNIITMTPLLFKKVFSRSFLLRIIETLLAPKKMKLDDIAQEIPELLSIVVSNAIQSRGIGTKLICALDDELKNKNINTYKVLAGCDLMQANAFYKKNNFKLIKQVEIHKGSFSNLYVRYI